MNPVNSWLDPEEVRRLAERLLRPVGHTSDNLPDAGFGKTFEGFAVDPETADRAASPLDQPESPPAPAATAARPQPPQAEASPPQPQPESPPPPPPAQDDPFVAAAKDFRKSLEERFSATGVFILDQEGAVVCDETGRGKLHFLARSLALAQRRHGDAPANVRIKIGADGILDVIQAESVRGRLVLGLLIPQPLPPEAVAEVRASLAGLGAPPVKS